MNLSEQENYLWAMRDACDSIKDEHLEIVRPEDEQNRLLASLVPDQVIHKFNDFISSSLEGFLMYADIYGVTEMCEKYNEIGMAGPLKATQILNMYLGDITQQIMLHGGDVLKFSKDVLVAFWKPTGFETMRVIAQKPIDCALAIQKSYGSRQTDIGVLLEAKLIIAAGPLQFSTINNKKTAKYLIYGRPIEDIKNPELNYKAGDIIVTSAIWKYTHRNAYAVDDLLNGKYQQIKHKMCQQEQKNEFSESSLRRCVDVVVRRNLHNQLEKFVITPVKKYIETNQPLSDLSETRQVVVVSINVVFVDPEPTEVFKLSRQSYKSVCSIVEEEGGCVNEITLFKGELSFLVIFGLRGLKRESECRIALKCATRCRQAIENLYLVMSVSAGITTGKIYCGLCGHHLRKEYMVVGSIIDTATRYATNHKNQTICDHETFLNSRLTVESFLFQTNNGSLPFYIYHDEVKSSHGEVEPVVSDFPLLGHDDKLELYRQFLSNFLDSPQNEETKRMLVIQGVARQGKTRLLSEFIRKTPAELPVHKINLSENDKKIPFETLRQIFWYKFQIHPFEKACNKLTEPFADHLIPQLCGLVNGIWRTHLAEKKWHAVTPETKLTIERDFMRRICLKAFTSKAIIIIDNLENVDHQSLVFIDMLLDSPNILLLASIGYGEPINPNIEAILMDQRVEVARLKAIDRRFHAALACQLMNVYAIPRELETVIQDKSNGHPGWIENVLFSLLQSECIIIKGQTMKEIIDARLICPHRHIVERFCHRLSICGKDEPPRIKAACLSQCACNIDNIRSELSMDTAVSRTLDSLLSYEQSVMKCASILGDQFSRDLLFHVLTPVSARELALAIKKLFKLKVLTCAKGKFSDSSMTAVDENTLPQESFEEMTCECRGNEIHETCQDLPKYGSCGYMKFYNTRVREIIYESTSDEQKKEFHLRTMEYLENERGICRTCDYGPLHQILNPTAEHDSMESLICQPTPSPSPSTSKQKTPTEINFENRGATEEFKSTWGFRDFSTEGYHNDCQCLPFLTAAYGQLNTYYQSVGRYFLKPSKVIDIMLQYADMLIRSSKLALAITVLDNALDVLKTTSHADLSWQNKLIGGKIYSLLGFVYMVLYEYDKAEDYLKSALEQYHCEFSPEKLTTKFKALRLRLKQSFGLFVSSKTFTKKNLSHWNSFVSNSASEVLSYLATLFMKKNQWQYAELAATWSLSKALKTNNNFETICTAYSNMLTVALHYKRRKLCAAIEAHALRLCKVPTKNITRKELKSVIKLYTSIYWSALSHANEKKANEIRNIALRIATSIQASESVMPTLPVLFC